MTSTGIVELASTGVRAVGYPELVTDNDQWHLGLDHQTDDRHPRRASGRERAYHVGHENRPGGSGVDERDARGISRGHAGGLAPSRRRSAAGRAAPSPDVETARRSLPKDMPVWILQDYDPKISPTDNRLKGAVATLAQPPGGTKGKFQYSNAGYMIAGLMLERVAGKPFEELFQQELLTPLEMRATGFGPPGTPGKRDQPWGHWPTGKWFGPDWRPLDPGDPFADIVPRDAPNGRAHASLQDMARFAAAHLAGARGKPGLLSVESFRKLQTPDTNGCSGRAFRNGTGLGAGGSIIRAAPPDGMLR